jgi:hypothetical protein
MTPVPSLPPSSLKRPIMNGNLVFAVAIAVATVVSAADDAKEFHCIDLKPHVNQKRGDSFGVDPENNLGKLPGGEQTFGGIKLNIEPGIIQLGSSVLETMPEKVEGIKVDRKFSKLHILHATQFGGGPNREGSPWFVKDGTLIGHYRINFEDKSSIEIPIVYGQDVRDWFYVEGDASPAKAKVVWSEENVFAATVGAKIRLYLTTWENPKPKKKVVSIDYLGKKDETVAAPFCVALSTVD